MVLALAGVAQVHAQDVPAGDTPVENSGDVNISIDLDGKGDGAQIVVGADGKCTVNGVEVDCDEAAENFGKGFGAFFGAGIAFVLIFFVVGILAFIFWIMMLVHAIKYPVDNKVLWIILMVIAGVLGSIIYYFAVKRHYGKMGMPMNNVPPSMPPSNPPTMPPTNTGQ